VPQPETASPGGSPAGAARRRPLSHGRQRLRSPHRFDPTDPSYNTSHVYRLKGPMDKGALAAAFTAVAARHESLRTRFHEEDGEPVVVAELAGLSEEEAARLMEAEN
jgi:hypothetical protein